MDLARRRRPPTSPPVTPLPPPAGPPASLAAQARTIDWDGFAFVFPDEDCLMVLLNSGRPASLPPDHQPRLAEGHTLFREGTRQLLERVDRFGVIGEAARGDEVVVQPLGVPRPQVDVQAELRRAPAGDAQHRRADIDRGQAHAGRVERKVAAGADGDLQDRAKRPASPSGPMIRKR